MARPLPLTGLRVFVEVGRHGSVKDAAAALNVTPGAVSQQLKLIEAQLRASLVERRNREIRLTVTGARLYENLAGAFQIIEDSVEPFYLVRPTVRSQKTLTVTTTESFAATWLVPRLHRFSQSYPAIEIRLDTTPRVVNLRSETQIDVAIRHGLGDYPGLKAVRFLTPRLIPVCSPVIFEGRRAPDDPAGCLEFPLLQDCDRSDWSLWLSAHGVRSAQAAQGPSFPNDHILMRAAISGQGIALVRDVYARSELEKGTLVIAIDRPWPTPFAYYLVTRPEATCRPRVQAFCEWVLSECSHSSPDIVMEPEVM